MKTIVENVLSETFESYLRVGLGMLWADRSLIIPERRVPKPGDILQMIEVSAKPSKIPLGYLKQREAIAKIIGVTACTEPDVYQIAFENVELSTPRPARV